MTRNVTLLADVRWVLPVLDAVLAAPEVRARRAAAGWGMLDRLTSLANVVLVRG